MTVAVLTRGMETMSGFRSASSVLFFAPSPSAREASQIGNPSKDRWRNLVFPLDI
jgi:hypothetical protein